MVMYNVHAWELCEDDVTEVCRFNESNGRTILFWIEINYMMT